LFIVAFPAGPPAATKLVLRQREMLHDPGDHDRVAHAVSKSVMGAVIS
jgi:hypothetical protein